MSVLRMRVTCHSFCIVLVLYKDHVGNIGNWKHFTFIIYFATFQMH